MKRIHWGVMRPELKQPYDLIRWPVAACGARAGRWGLWVHPNRTRVTCKRCKKIPSVDRNYSPLFDVGNVPDDA